jgi:terminase large subunit-like protein
MFDPIQKIPLKALEALVRMRELRDNPILFARTLGYNPDDWQAEFLESVARYTLLLASRQGGKSETTSLKVLHRALFRPKSLIVIVSPGVRQSGLIFNQILSWLNIYMPLRDLPEENKTTLEFPNDSRIVALPGKEATIRGFSSVNLLVGDESSRIPDPLFKAVQPMLLNSQGDFIGITTPWGKRGWFFREWQGEDGLAGKGIKDDWFRSKNPVTSIPRIMNDPEKRAFLEREKRRDLRWFKQEYLCEFVELEDGLFPDALIEEAFDPTVIPLFTGDPGMQPDDGEVESLQFNLTEE